MKRVKRFFKWLWHLDWDPKTGMAIWVLMIPMGVIFTIWPILLAYFWGIILGLFMILVFLGLIITGFSAIL